jgi:hypothetical protein
VQVPMDLSGKEEDLSDVRYCDSDGFEGTCSCTKVHTVPYLVCLRDICRTLFKCMFCIVLVHSCIPWEIIITDSNLLVCLSYSGLREWGSYKPF